MKEYSHVTTRAAVAGALLAIGSAIAMTAYLLTVGTDRADPRISALGALVGLAGLALAGSTGGRPDRRDGSS
ncbi:hypothetical protein ACQEVF_47625 [Nonomuraea polychroma]|uniref:hypothetical protein n=1 Tax=Nonomuraea polychroma TaxID=46176 RepID=UPI003D8B95E6